VKRNKYKYNNIFRKWSENMAYILGFITADGGVHKRTLGIDLQIVRKNGRLELTKKKFLELLKNKMLSCKRCDLRKSCKNIVFGEGNIDAEIMLIGEASGEMEDEQGVPFCGRSGILLNKILKKVGLERKNIFISNIVHCRPPNNRNPTWEEIRICLPYLWRQIKTIMPKMILTLGSIPTRAIMDDKVLSITKERGIIQDIYFRNEKDEILKIKILPTFHPAYLLRNGSEKNYKNVYYDFFCALNYCEKLKNGIGII